MSFHSENIDTVGSCYEIEHVVKDQPFAYRDKINKYIKLKSKVEPHDKPVSFSTNLANEGSWSFSWFLLNAAL